MKVAVVGAGAMGSLFGGLLAPVAPVVLIDPWLKVPPAQPGYFLDRTVVYSLIQPPTRKLSPSFMSRKKISSLSGY